MLSRRQFFMKAISRSRKGSGEHAEKAHVDLTVVVGLIVVVLFLFGVATHFHEFAVVVGTAVVAITVFVYWVCFESYYRIYREEFLKGEQLIAERDAALERLKPKLRIRDETEYDPAEDRWRIRIESLS